MTVSTTTIISMVMELKSKLAVAMVLTVMVVAIGACSLRCESKVGHGMVCSGLLLLYLWKVWPSSKTFILCSKVGSNRINIQETRNS